MKDRRKVLELSGAILAGLVAIGALVTFVLNYMDTRNTLTVCERELQTEKERNRRAFELLQRGTSEGRITPTELTRYLSEDDAAAIVQKAGLEVKAPLPFQLDTQFYPSGWMGDGEYGTKYLTLARKASPDMEGGIYIEVKYSAGPNGSAGIYWLYPDKNWGNFPGKSLVGARAITFRAKGGRGGELIEFKSGGVRGKKYSDTYERSLDVIRLQPTWQEYRVDLSGADLSNVIGAFAWSASAADNNGEVHFYLGELTVR
ncbi:MAG: hypothetical protein NTW38_01790 [Candidatus Aminicenantes bacterium]|nr:hypothetical protein [Candidatus Aminicenantes bacterium]